MWGWGFRRSRGLAVVAGLPGCQAIKEGVQPEVGWLPWQVENTSGGRPLTRCPGATETSDSPPSARGPCSPARPPAACFEGGTGGARGKGRCWQLQFKVARAANIPQVPHLLQPAAVPPHGLLGALGMQLGASLDQQGEREHVEQRAYTDQEDAHAARPPRRDQITAHDAAEATGRSRGGGGLKGPASVCTWRGVGGGNTAPAHDRSLPGIRPRRCGLYTAGGSGGEQGTRHAHLAVGAVSAAWGVGWPRCGSLGATGRPGGRREAITRKYQGGDSCWLLGSTAVLSTKLPGGLRPRAHSRRANVLKALLYC